MEKNEQTEGDKEMQQSGTIKLKTDRLELRTVTEADTEVVRSIGPDEFPTDEAALDWIRWVRKKNAEGRLIVCFYIWPAGTTECVGRVYLHSKPELDGKVELAYGIAREHRRNGYATEAGEAAVRFAFEEAGQDFLAAIVKPDNIPSQRVIKKLGFERCGARTIPDELGETCRFDYFRLYRDDWRSRKEQASI